MAEHLLTQRYTDQIVRCAMDLTCVRTLLGFDASSSMVIRIRQRLTFFYFVVRVWSCFQSESLDVRNGGACYLTFVRIYLVRVLPIMTSAMLSSALISAQWRPGLALDCASPSIVRPVPHPTAR